MHSVVHIQGRGSSTEKRTYPFCALTENIPEEERPGNAQVSLQIPGYTMTEPELTQ